MTLPDFSACGALPLMMSIMTSSFKELYSAQYFSSLVTVSYTHLDVYKRQEQGANQHFLVGNGGFVQIDLPVHQAAGGAEVLNRIDAFGLYYQVVILYIQHLDNAGGANAVSYTQLLRVLR